MKLSREILLAHVEGSLPPEEDRRVAAEVAKDGALFAYVEEQKRLNARLQTVFAPAAEGCVSASPPPAPIEANRPAASSDVENRAKPSSHWIPATAMAAGIALGALLAGSFGAGMDVRSQGGVLTAQGNLARILSTQLASEQNGSAPAPARIGVSFVSKDGYFCRSFETTGAQGTLYGIACRVGSIWRIAALGAAELREATALRPAGFDMPLAIRDALTAMIVGDPLNGDAERAARNQAWRPR